MKHATITIPDELQDALDDYIRRQEEPSPEVSSVVQTALREFLARHEQPEEREFHPFRITPARKGSGYTDVSINHDKYFAEDEYKDSFGKS